MILAITNTFRPACLAPMPAATRLRRRGMRSVGCGEVGYRAVLPLRMIVVNMIGRDGAGGGGLVVARLVTAPSRPYIVIRLPCVPRSA